MKRTEHQEPIYRALVMSPANSNRIKHSSPFEALKVLDRRFREEVSQFISRRVTDVVYSDSSVSLSFGSCGCLVFEASSEGTVEWSVESESQGMQRARQRIPLLPGRLLLAIHNPEIGTRGEEEFDRESIRTLVGRELASASVSFSRLYLGFGEQLEVSFGVLHLVDIDTLLVEWHLGKPE